MRDVEIIICGATGRLGHAVAHALVAQPELGAHPVALVAPSYASTPTRPAPDGIATYTQLAEAIAATRSDVLVVELTHAEPAIEHLEQCLDAGRHVVVGATGFAPGVLEAWGERFAARRLGLLHVPNFSIGATLMIKAAELVARVLPNVEIVETHHHAKRDAPSGTARLTAARIAAARAVAGHPAATASAEETHAGDGPARGEAIDGIAVHALRLLGATAHQEVVFGGTGELLTIRHDALDRSCYAPGVARAAQGVGARIGLSTGLETVL